MDKEEQRQESCSIELGSASRERKWKRTKRDKIDKMDNPEKALRGVVPVKGRTYNESTNEGGKKKRSYDDWEFSSPAVATYEGLSLELPWFGCTTVSLSLSKAH